MIIGILSILLWLGIVPFGIGTLITAVFSVKNNRYINKYLFGLIVYFSLFQVIAVSNMLTVNNFFDVCTGFMYVCAGLSVLGIRISALLNVIIFSSKIIYISLYTFVKFFQDKFQKNILTNPYRCDILLIFKERL